MTSFASLMALSATHTRESQQEVQNALQERKRKETLLRKQQEEKDAREREQAKQLRMKIFEEEKRQKARMERLEAEQKAKEAARDRKEEEQRNHLLYGPKKAAKLSAAGGGGGGGYPSSSSGVKDAVRKTRLPDDDNDTPGIVLTRDEIRQRKKEADMKKLFHGPKRSSGSGGGYHRHTNRLPGGAVNIVVNAEGQQTTASAVIDDHSSGRTLKERLTQGPNKLTLLRTQARDRRTVDEAQQDIRIKLGKATTKVLSGEEARSFDDWFGGSKDKPANRSPGPVSASPTPAPTASSSRQAPTPTMSASTSSSQKKAGATSTQRPYSTKPANSTTSKSSAAVSRASSSEKYTTTSSQAKYPKINKSSNSTSTPSHRPSAVAAHRESQNKHKRPRSLSRSESPPPRRRPRRDVDGDDTTDLSQTIWALFGKDKNQYTARDIVSDDEDMEADATLLEREEHISARIAKREEMQALDEERRHEEEKRRRKKERERALARGH